jgi:hypothetical protein
MAVRITGRRAIGHSEQTAQGVGQSRCWRAGMAARIAQPMRSARRAQVLALRAQRAASGVVENPDRNFTGSPSALLSPAGTSGLLVPPLSRRNGGPLGPIPNRPGAWAWPFGRNRIDYDYPHIYGLYCRAASDIEHPSRLVLEPGRRPAFPSGSQRAKAPLSPSVL